MRKTLMVMDVRDFGVIEHPRHSKFGMELSQGLIHTYLVGYSRWGMGQLDTACDYEAFAATILENTDGFHLLNDLEKDLLLYESVQYLQSFIDYVESRLADQRIDVFPPLRPHRRVMLLVG